MGSGCGTCASSSAERNSTPHGPDLADGPRRRTRPGVDMPGGSGTDPDIDELQLLDRWFGRHLGKARGGEHGVNRGLDALGVEALPVLP